MENVSNLAQLIGRVLGLAVFAFVMTVVVYLARGFCGARLQALNSGACLALLA